MFPFYRGFLAFGGVILLGILYFFGGWLLILTTLAGFCMWEFQDLTKASKIIISSTDRRARTFVGSRFASAFRSSHPRDISEVNYNSNCTASNSGNNFRFSNDRRMGTHSAWQNDITRPNFKNFPDENKCFATRTSGNTANPFHQQNSIFMTESNQRFRLSNKENHELKSDQTREPFFGNIGVLPRVRFAKRRLPIVTRPPVRPSWTPVTVRIAPPEVKSTEEKLPFIFESSEKRVDPCNAETVVAALREKRKRTLKNDDSGNEFDSNKRLRRESSSSSSSAFTPINSPFVLNGSLCPFTPNPGQLIPNKPQGSISPKFPSDAFMSFNFSMKKCKNNPIFSSYSSSNRMLKNEVVRNVKNPMKRKMENAFGKSPGTAQKLLKANSSFSEPSSSEEHPNTSSSGITMDMDTQKNDIQIHENKVNKTVSENLNSSSSTSANINRPPASGVLSFTSPDHHKAVIPAHLPTLEEHEHDFLIEERRLKRLLLGLKEVCQEKDEVSANASASSGKTVFDTTTSAGTFSRFPESKATPLSVAVSPVFASGLQNVASSTSIDNKNLLLSTTSTVQSSLPIPPPVSSTSVSTAGSDVTPTCTDGNSTSSTTLTTSSSFLATTSSGGIKFGPLLTPSTGSNLPSLSQNSHFSNSSTAIAFQPSSLTSPLMSVAPLGGSSYSVSSGGFPVTSTSSASSQVASTSSPVTVPFVPLLNPASVASSVTKISSETTPGGFHFLLPSATSSSTLLSTNTTTTTTNLGSIMTPSALSSTATPLVLNNPFPSSSTSVSVPSSSTFTPVSNASPPLSMPSSNPAFSFFSPKPITSTTVNSSLLVTTTSAPTNFTLFTGSNPQSGLALNFKPLVSSATQPGTLVQSSSLPTFVRTENQSQQSKNADKSVSFNFAPAGSSTASSSVLTFPSPFASGEGQKSTSAFAGVQPFTSMNTTQQPPSLFPVATQSQSQSPFSTLPTMSTTQGMDSAFTKPQMSFGDGQVSTSFGTFKTTIDTSSSAPQPSVGFGIPLQSSASSAFNISSSRPSLFSSPPDQSNKLGGVNSATPNENSLSTGNSVFQFGSNSMQPNASFNFPSRTAASSSTFPISGFSANPAFNFGGKSHIAPLVPLHLYSLQKLILILLIIQLQHLSHSLSQPHLSMPVHPNRHCFPSVQEPNQKDDLTAEEETFEND